MRGQKNWCWWRDNNFMRKRGERLLRRSWGNILARLDLRIFKNWSENGNILNKNDHIFLILITLSFKLTLNEKTLISISRTFKQKSQHKNKIQNKSSILIYHICLSAISLPYLTIHENNDEIIFFLLYNPFINGNLFFF